MYTIFQIPINYNIYYGESFLYWLQVQVISSDLSGIPCRVIEPFIWGAQITQKGQTAPYHYHCRRYYKRKLYCMHTFNLLCNKKTTCVKVGWFHGLFWLPTLLTTKVGIFSGKHTNGSSSLLYRNCAKLFHIICRMQ